MIHQLLCRFKYDMVEVSVGQPLKLPSAWSGRPIISKFGYHEGGEVRQLPKEGRHSILHASRRSHCQIVSCGTRLCQSGHFRFEEVQVRRAVGIVLLIPSTIPMD